MTIFDTVIVSGGEVQDDFALDFLRKMQEQQKLAGLPPVRLIAADRGLDFFCRQGMIPDIVVGDFDSLSAEGKIYLEGLSAEPVQNLREPGSISGDAGNGSEQAGILSGQVCRKTEIVRLKPEKDDSDTQSALNFAVRRGAKRIAVLGAMGKRIDHLMANFGLLVLGRELGAEVCLLDAWNYAALAWSGMILKKEEQFGKYVSFFAVCGNVEGLTLTGFKYGLEGHSLRLSDSGFTVSNEIAGDEARVDFGSGTLLMIMSRD